MVATGTTLLGPAEQALLGEYILRGGHFPKGLIKGWAPLHQVGHPTHVSASTLIRQQRMTSCMLMAFGGPQGVLALVSWNSEQITDRMMNKAARLRSFALMGNPLGDSGGGGNRRSQPGGGGSQSVVAIPSLLTYRLVPYTLVLRTAPLVVSLFMFLRRPEWLAFGLRRP